MQAIELKCIRNIEIRVTDLGILLKNGAMLFYFCGKFLISKNLKRYEYV